MEMNLLWCNRLVLKVLIPGKKICDSIFIAGRIGQREGHRSIIVLRTHTKPYNVTGQEKCKNSYNQPLKELFS